MRSPESAQPGPATANGSWRKMKPQLIVMLLVSLALGYELAYTQSTRRLAIKISSADGWRFIQDALTPPRSNLVGCATYLWFTCGVTLVWLRFNWYYAVTICIISVMIVGLTASSLLKYAGNWFEGSVIRSMMRRYADFVKEGDVMRANAASELLGRLGYPVPEAAYSKIASVRVPGLPLSLVQWTIILIGLIGSVFTIVLGWDDVVEIARRW